VALVGCGDSDTYGVAALHGPGSEHFPALLSSKRDRQLVAEEEQQQQPQQQQPRHFTLSPKQVFIASSSDWALADLLSIGGTLPCFYECSASCQGEGMPLA